MRNTSARDPGQTIARTVDAFASALGSNSRLAHRELATRVAADAPVVIDQRGDLWRDEWTLAARARSPGTASPDARMLSYGGG